MTDQLATRLNELGVPKLQRTKDMIEILLANPDSVLLIHAVGDELFAHVFKSAIKWQTILGHLEQNKK